MILRMRDVRAAGMCSRGVRLWFKRYNLSWEDFLKNGIESEKVSATGCAMGQKVVDVAEQRRGNDQ